MYNRDYERQQFEDWHRYGRERGWLDRATDAVRSWFGDEDAERRRMMDSQSHGSSGRGGWGRDDERGEIMPSWQRRDYSGMSPRGYELEEKGRFGMDDIHSSQRHRQQRSNYGNEYSRGGEYGGGRFNGEREMYGQGQGGFQGERYGREEYGTGRQGGYGRQFFGHEGRDFEQQQQQGVGRFFAGSMFDGSHRGRGPRNYQRSDERISDEIHQLLTFHPEIDATDIEVLVEKGVVSLRGKVENRMSKRLTEDLAEDVYGVREVRNELRVDSLFSRKEEQPATPQTASPRNLTGR